MQPLPAGVPGFAGNLSEHAVFCYCKRTLAQLIRRSVVPIPVLVMLHTSIVRMLLGPADRDVWEEFVQSALTRGKESE